MSGRTAAAAMIPPAGADDADDADAGRGAQKNFRRGFAVGDFVARHQHVDEVAHAGQRQRT